MISVSIQQLRKNYACVHALDGLDMAVQPGSVYGFLGPNGAGKTTTLRILAGLASPTSGEIQLGEPEEKAPTGDPRALVGYLPEEPAFYTWMNPLEYLVYIGKIFKIKGNQNHKRAAQLLELCGLQDVAKRRIAGFSRGMRQRLGIAQALMNRPTLLLLDEPVSALDPAGRKEVLELIEGLGNSCTVVMSSHILADVERVCDTVGIIHKGRMIVQDKKEALLERYAIPALELTLGNGAITQLSEWQEKLVSLPGVSGVTTVGYTFHLAVQEVNITQQEIMRLALQHQLRFDKLEVVKPSLEDIFMQLTGSQE